MKSWYINLNIKEWDVKGFKNSTVKHSKLSVRTGEVLLVYILYACVVFSWSIKRDKLVKIRSFWESTVASVWNTKGGDTMLLKALKGGMREGNGTVALPHGWSVGLAGGSAVNTLHSGEVPVEAGMLMVPYGATQRMATPILSLSAWLSRNNGKLY